MTLTIRTVYEPIGYGFSETSETISDFFSGLFQANRLVEENARLKSLAESAALYEESIKRLEDENKRLK